MDILFLLIPIALGFLVIALAIFFWAIRNGQYDDMESQGLKIIMDEHRTDKKSKDKSDSSLDDSQTGKQTKDNSEDHDA